MALGSNLAGRAINITKTTAPHAMSYKITTTYGTPHGLAVALTMPWCAEFLLSDGTETVKDSLDIIAKALKLENRYMIPEYFLALLKKLPVKFPDIMENDIDYLASSVNIERLKNMPVVPEITDIAEIYSKAAEFCRKMNNTD